MSYLLELLESSCDFRRDPSRHLSRHQSPHTGDRSNKKKKNASIIRREWGAVAGEEDRLTSEELGTVSRIQLVSRKRDNTVTWHFKCSVYRFQIGRKITE